MHNSQRSHIPSGGTFHSNKYAAGSLSPQGFQERVAIEKRRSVIGKYHHSQIGRATANRPESLAAGKQADAINTTPSNVSAERQSFNARANTARPQQKIIAPLRNYNPYA